MALGGESAFKDMPTIYHPDFGYKKSRRALEAFCRIVNFLMSRDAFGVARLRRQEGRAGEGGQARHERKASSGQKEMLMPIEGKKPKEAAAKKPAAKPQRKSA
ncbi:hypothetical protein [Bradyrhizobium sp. Rc2d]|uniref:hypothetical protein n=1 Tax=Bradyrhizobium sp. Rc2d TaxID=1855321 RepID=UPI000B8220FB|nr:hypothetical protein [Bradyrhizobium sp. Rc2d]